MLKMIDVLEQNLVQNFTHSLNTRTSQFDELVNQGILNSSEISFSDNSLRPKIWETGIFF